MFSGVFIAEEVDGKRRLVVRKYHNGWCRGTFGCLFEHVSEICMFHGWNFFLFRSKNSVHVTSLKC
jgi:hypothetical protein